ncbi:MAG: prolyl oligopeptidase family serine peptidase [Archangium sp.]|nr:prolyl oligopeptidase family serine peptidase [Archangium sp.]
MRHWVPWVIAVVSSCTPVLPVEVEPVVQTPAIESPPLTQIVSAPPEPVVDAGVLIELGEAPSFEARTWFLSIDREPFTLTLPATPTEAGALSDASQRVEPVTDVAGPDAQGGLRFRTVRHGATAWFDVRVVSGVLAGRWAHSDSAPTDASLFTGHVTGWNLGAFERVPARVYRLQTEGGELITLRLDGLFDEGTPVGRWKRYGTVLNGWRDESDEFELEITSWQPPTIGFRIIGDRLERTCEAMLGASSVSGSCVSGLGRETFVGARTEVLTFGLHARSAEARATWQASTRKAIELLAMGSTPRASEVSVVSAGAALPPLPVLTCLSQRDDELAQHPANYTRQELELTARYVNAAGVEHLRRLHGWLLIPTGPMPEGGFPAVVSLNGHSGSARMMTDPDSDMFWYGESFARRGSVVFAVDVSHRPLSDRGLLYTDYLAGDAPGDGNGPHPAIRFAGLDSDWEEDGERAADAMSARRLLAGQPFVDAAHIGVMGLSLGGEATLWAAAVDPEFRFAIAAGFSPDTDVFRISGNHPCFGWQHADSTQYLTSSDLHALIAPRALVVETGARDWVFSATSTPFAQALQVTRRSREAWAPEQGAGFLHYLHDDFHHFHVGGVTSCGAGVATGVTTPLLSEPTPQALVSWQTSSATQVVASDLFGWLPATP